jgi:hypothetical protein
MTTLRKLLLSATSAVALGVLSVPYAPVARAADAPVVCESGLAGTLGAGYIFGNVDVSEPFFILQADDDDDDDSEIAIGTFFGEGAALYRFCDIGLNIQGDFAFHSHQVDADDLFRGKHSSSDAELANDRWHVGGILFWRDEDLGLLGVDGSFINDDIDGYNFESSRIGLRGEFFAGDMFTLGAGAGYVDGETFGNDWDGYDANIWGRFYATDSIGLLARFDWADFGGDFEDVSTWAVTGEGELKLPEYPLSIFAGVRYAEQETDGGKFGSSTDLTQVYVGLKVYFGSNGLSLSDTQRSNTLDNTNVILERLPASFFGGKSPG